jgi:hypothetical protein
VIFEARGQNCPEDERIVITDGVNGRLYICLSSKLWPEVDLVLSPEDTARLTEALVAYQREAKEGR